MSERYSDEWLREMALKSQNLGFDAFCTDCENATFLSMQGRCGCGSGRVVTVDSLSPKISNSQSKGEVK